MAEEAIKHLADSLQLENSGATGHHFHESKRKALQSIHVSVSSKHSCSDHFQFFQWQLKPLSLPLQWLDEIRAALSVPIQAAHRFQWPEPQLTAIPQGPALGQGVDGAAKAHSLQRLWEGMRGMERVRRLLVTQRTLATANPHRARCH